MPKIISYYQTVTPESAEQGDFADSGEWHEYWDSKEDWDRDEEPMTESAARWLYKHFAQGTSSTSFHKGM